jgi:hypothetical protein
VRHTCYISRLAETRAKKSVISMLLSSEDIRKMNKKSLIVTALLAGAAMMSANRALAQDPIDEKHQAVQEGC